MDNAEFPAQEKDLKQAYRTAYLIAGFLKQKLTQEEKVELDQWILARDENMELFERMTDERNIAEALAWFKKLEVENDLIRTKKQIHFTKIGKSGKIWKYAVAASVAIAVIIGFYFYESIPDRDNDINVVKTNDMLPGTGKASLTLENGNIIFLDETVRDTLINDFMKILQKQSEIIYDNKITSGDIVYHTLTVPRKAYYKLTLPDGSRVWLNAESSIRFPIAFQGKERKVSITGEAFFEVAKDNEKPFRVVTGETTIEALGTQFNVNSYSNEPFVSATLIEGSVLVSKGDEENILRPGQQAILHSDGFRVVKAAIDEVVAWKNDQFKFTNTPIDAIMRQVERWYDAEIVYNDKVVLHLNATIDRKVPVSKLLGILEKTGQVHFKIEGNKIIVMK